jgi:sterol 3beta-glucosyltransferase
MRILILTFGTRGDVQPYVALAHAAIAAGHDAAVCTAPRASAPWVEDAAVPYLPTYEQRRHVGHDPHPGRDADIARLPLSGLRTK